MASKNCESSLHSGQTADSPLCMQSFLTTRTDISWPLGSLGESTLSNAYLSGFLYQLIQQKITQAAVTPRSKRHSYFQFSQLEGVKSTMANTNSTVNAPTREEDGKVMKVTYKQCISNFIVYYRWFISYFSIIFIYLHSKCEVKFQFQ